MAGSPRKIRARDESRGKWLEFRRRSERTRANPRPLRQPLSFSRGVSIFRRVFYYISSLLGIYEPGANASGHVYVNGGLPDPSNLSQRRKNSEVRHFLDTRVSQTSGTAGLALENIFTLTKRCLPGVYTHICTLTSFYRPRRTYTWRNSLRQVGHRLPATKREK